MRDQILKYVKHLPTWLKSVINAISKGINLQEAVRVSSRLNLVKNIVWLIKFGNWTFWFFLFVITFEQSLESFKSQMEIFNLFHKMSPFHPQIFLLNFFFFLFCRLPHLCKWWLSFLVAKAETHICSFLYYLSVPSGKPVGSTFKIPNFYSLLLWSVLRIHPYFSLRTLKYLITSLYASVIAFLQIIVHIAATGSV